MNPKALGFYWFLSTATLAVAIAAPAFVWVPLIVFAIYFIYSVV